MIRFSCAFSIWWSCLIYRYLRLFVNEWAFLTHRNIPLPLEPKLSPRDVTVVIPCLNGDGIEATLQSITATGPAKVILVTIHANLERAKLMLKGIDMLGDVLVMSVPQANKRKQMMHALSEIDTPITVFADDDVTWPITLLPWMLAPLENEKYGGVGTNQWLRSGSSPSFGERFWRFLNLLYLQRRNFDCSACNQLDGGLPCLSGRTVAYRTSMIKDKRFMQEFEEEVWGLGKGYRLAVDDDNFITRWTYACGKKIAFQYHPEAEVLTELEANPKYLKQCLRWSRSNWRSNCTSMFVEGRVWSEHPWSSYAVFLTTLTHWAPVWDISLWVFRPKGGGTFWLLLGIMTFSKVVKLVPIFVRNPRQVFWLPVSIGFGQFHAFIKLYALFTLHVTAWGSRDGADENDDFRMREITEPDGLNILPFSHNELIIDSGRLARTADQEQQLLRLGAEKVSTCSTPSYARRDTGSTCQPSFSKSLAALHNTRHIQGNV